MSLRVYILLLFLTGLSFTSCRTEETEFTQAPQDETLIANSSISLLMQRTASNDGSFNNIVDRANCIDIAYPYTITANGEQITLNSRNDLATIECIFDQSDSDTDTSTITYPITIIQADFSEVVVNNLTELNSFTSGCNGENITDNDIECIDFEYPIEASKFNSVNELLETINIESDKQLYEFIENISINDIVSVNFPVNVRLPDSSLLNINNLIELESTIQNAINICDEDDDYDYSDDDCNDCTPDNIKNVLTNCSNWIVNRLERNNTNYDNIYYNYAFNFFIDGTMAVSWNSNIEYGTYTTSGSGNNLEVLINIPALPLCNNNWRLQEVKNCSFNTEINFIVSGTNDRLQYENNCN